MGSDQHERTPLASQIDAIGTGARRELSPSGAAAFSSCRKAPWADV